MRCNRPCYSNQHCHCSARLPVGVCVADTLQLHLATQLLMWPQARRQLRCRLVIQVCQHTLTGTNSLQGTWNSRQEGVVITNCCCCSVGIA